MISGGMELILVVLDKPDGNFRMRKGDLLHQICHVGTLGHGSFQKFPTYRCIVEEISYDKGCPIRRTDLFHAPFFSAFDLITASGQ